jgi:hypothetical protein
MGEHRCVGKRLAVVIASLSVACANAADARQAAVDREMKLVAEQATGDLTCEAAQLDGQIVREIGAQRDYRVTGCGKPPLVYVCETPDTEGAAPRCVRAAADLKPKNATP